jgi:WD40 repeat protein
MEDPINKTTDFKILSISNKKLTPLPITFQSDLGHWWHPTDPILIYPAKDKNALVFLDASTMSFRELLFKDQDSRYKISDLAWSPNGDKLIFITESHNLWQVDYPALENLEQIIASVNTIGGAQFSPDGKSISFISGTDIYIVDTVK